jgi:hypothetical protein
MVGDITTQAKKAGHAIEQSIYSQLSMVKIKIDLGVLLQWTNCHR